MHCVATGPAHGSLSKDKLRGDICIAVLLPPRRGETLLVLDSGAARHVADTHLPCSVADEAAIRGARPTTATAGSRVLGSAAALLLIAIH